MDASVICAKIARMKNTLASLALLSLCACQPQDPTGAPAPPPADAPAAAATTAAPEPGSSIDISQPIRAVGTEPFWALTIDGTGFKLERPDKPTLTATAPGAAIQSGQAVWVAKTPEGQQVTVTLRASPCSDGMSDRKYPISAEVALLNESLYGCAAKVADFPAAK